MFRLSPRDYSYQVNVKVIPMSMPLVRQRLDRIIVKGDNVDNYFHFARLLHCKHVFNIEEKHFPAPRRPKSSRFRLVYLPILRAGRKILKI